VCAARAERSVRGVCGDAVSYFGYQNYLTSRSADQ